MSWSSKILRDSGLSRPQLLGGLFVLLVSMVGYSFSGFLLDDTLHLAGIITGQGPDNLTYSIEPDQLDIYLLRGTEPIRFEYLRPLTSLSMQIDHMVFGLRPFGFHLVSTLLHLVNVCLVFHLGRRLSLTPGTAWAAAVLWGISVPAGLATGWISGRSEILAATCVLAAMFSVHRHHDSGARRWLAAASLLLILGTLAKESAAVGAPLTLVFILLAHGKREGTTRTSLLRPGAQIALWGPVMAGLILRYFLIGFPRIPEPYFQPPDSPASAYAVLLKGILYLLGGLTGLPVIPFIQVEGLQHHVAATIVAVLISAAGLGLLFQAAPRTRGRLLLAWFLIALIPALFVMAFSLYLYLPLIGLCWLFGLAWQKKRSWLIKSWMIWLTAVGILTNVTLGACLWYLGSMAQDAREVMEDLLRPGGVEDVVILDAPFWSYSLPVTTRLLDPTLSFRTHFLNFSPYLKPGTPSDVTWAGESEFVIAAPDRRFFESPIERFFLFGHDPCLEDSRGTAFTMVCLGPNGDNQRPEILRVVLDRSGTDPGLVLLQFDGWRLHRLLPSPGPGNPAPPAQ